VAVATRRTRKYAIYVSGTQDQADDHVFNVSALLETPELERTYPDVCRRSLNKYGHSRGWRRNRLRTASGFTVDALGLNTGARGIKLEMDRPDFIILDDVDDEIDTVNLVHKKEKVIQRKLLPAGSTDASILAVQNLIWSESIFSRLVEGRSKYLLNRRVSGPHPAITNLQLEQENGRPLIKGGEPTWEGLNLARCQSIVDDIGIDAFLKEHQHETKGKREGALWDQDMIGPHRVLKAPELKRVVVGVDPAGSSQPGSSETGIVAVGLGVDDHAYVLRDLSGKWKPAEWAARACRCFHELQADRIVGERNFGGDMVEATVRTHDPNVSFKGVNAARGKVIRAEPVAALYEQGKVHHVGVFLGLEEQLTTWVPGEKSPDRLDALGWAIHELMVGNKHHQLFI
jgi:hypothetical protein